MSNNPSVKAIEPWQLTAYALNELEPYDAIKVEQAIDSDAALRIELEQIQQTLTAVRSALATSANGVTLSENQTAAVTNQLQQVVAPKPATAQARATKVTLPERPFYRRKRFAALLATAAAIPLALTWMPDLFQKVGTMALSVPGQTLPSSYYLNDDVQYMPDASTAVVNSLKEARAKSKAEADLTREEIATSGESKFAESNQPASIVSSEDAIAAGSGLLGDVDISFAPEMGVVIVKGTKTDVERVQKVIEEIKQREGGLTEQVAESAERRIKVTEVWNVAQSQPKPSLSSSSPIAEGIETKPFDRLDSLADEGKQTDEHAAITSGNNVSGLDSGPVVLGGIKLKSEMSNLAKGKQAPGETNTLMTTLSAESLVPDERKAVALQPSLIATDRYLSDASRAAGGMGGGGMGGGGMGGGGMGMGMGGPSSGSGGGLERGLGRLPTPTPGLSVNESLASHDKHLHDTDFKQLQKIPAELRQNAPHLFKAPTPEKSGTDRFEKIAETPFQETQKAPLSTFSIDVDTASYCKIRQTLMEANRLPSPSMVRIEEMVNYFEYGYAGPQDERPFAAHMSIDRCPWNSEHQLVRVGLQAKKMNTDKRVKANIVFLLDVSGSMNEPNRLPLVKKALSMMVNQLTENDRVAIVVYAGAAGCVLPSICGAEKQTILSSLDHLNAGGSTNGGQGIQLAYSIAKEHFIPGGANRVVLCTDGDFNVGVTGDDALVAMMQENAKSNIFLTCLGFGAGNYNDAMMEKISNKGNGIYGMIDNELEARRMMVEQLSGTLVTVAKDVKIQVDFNPAKVAGYRLIGYDDRRLANKDFANDQKDAGEIGAGHRVTALYEVIPVGKWVGATSPSDSESSKYSKKPTAEPKFETPAAGEFSAEVLTLKVRYKEPEGSVSTLQEFVLKDAEQIDKPLVDRDMQWATSVAEFGLLLRRSEMAPQADWTEMLERAASSAGGNAYRLECLAMMRKAKSMLP